MSITFYHILHVLSVLALTGYTFYAFAAPAETRRKVMALSGIASLLVLISGFGMWGKQFGMQFQLWVALKIVAWLVMSALAGVAYRRRSIVGILQVVALAVLFLALFAVYTKPV